MSDEPKKRRRKPNPGELPDPGWLLARLSSTYGVNAAETLMCRLFIDQRERLAGIEASLSRQRRATHGAIDGLHAWGCPDCVAEMRREIAAVRALAARWRQGSAAGDDRTAADCADELEALLAGGGR